MVLHVYVLLAIAQGPSYIPGSAGSFWKLMGLLLTVVGYLIALSLIWVLLRWVVKKFVAAFHEKMIRTFTKSVRVKDHRGVDLFSDALSFSRLRYAGAPQPLR